MDLLGVVLAVLTLVIGVAVGWWLAGRAAAARLTEQELRLRSESEAAVLAVRNDLVAAQSQVELLKADRQALEREKTETATITERIEPLKETLEVLRRQAQAAEVERAKSAAELREQIAGVQRNYTSLETATKQLVSAMSSGQSRGQWGEMQLEQLLEYSGLIEGVHYFRQDSRASSELGVGTTSRPDIVIALPGGGEILIDAKFPFDAYWRAIEAGDSPEVSTHLSKHASDVLARVKELSSKRYWESTKSPDFVVMFLPLESLLSTALDVNGGLLTEAFDKNVTLATPTSLLPMLRTVAFGYQRKMMADNAEEIRQAGVEMLARLEKAVDHLGTMRKGLGQAIKGYNDFVGSFDSRVMVQARRMKELGVASSSDLALPGDLLETLREPRDSESS